MVLVAVGLVVVLCNVSVRRRTRKWQHDNPDKDLYFVVVLRLVAALCGSDCSQDFKFKNSFFKLFLSGHISSANTVGGGIGK